MTNKEELAAQGFEPPTLTTWELDEVLSDLLRKVDKESRPALRGVLALIVHHLSEYLDERDEQTKH